MLKGIQTLTALKYMTVLLEYIDFIQLQQLDTEKPVHVPHPIGYVTVCSIVNYKATNPCFLSPAAAYTVFYKSYHIIVIVKLFISTTVVLKIQLITLHTYIIMYLL